MRHKRSSSVSSGSLSSSNHSSKTKRYKSSKSKKYRSRSSSRTRSKKDRDRRSRSRDRHRRRRHSSSSSCSSRSRSRSRSKSKKYKKSKKSRRRSSSQSSNSQSKDIMFKDKYRQTIQNMEREKNYEFKESVDELYKSEQGRKHISEKLDDGGGFRPQSFKSSRSTKKSTKNSNNAKLTAEQEHDAAIFGSKKKVPITANQNLDAETKYENAKLAAPIEVNVVNSNVKTLMHEKFFEDIIIKEERWKQKMLQLINGTHSTLSKEEIVQ